MSTCTGTLFPFLMVPLTWQQQTVGSNTVVEPLTNTVACWLAFHPATESTAGANVTLDSDGPAGTVSHDPTNQDAAMTHNTNR
jgi:hypothetical protein